MLRDGEKGAVLQRDGKTYGIVPHLPCGLVSPDMLRKIALVAEKYHATLKCTGAQRIAILGLKEEDIDAAWKDLGGERPGHVAGNVVRSVQACPGTDFCKRARQDSLALGLELDKRYHGRPLPGKMKIGVAGCGNQCTEITVKDIGLLGGPRGWRIAVGGAAGMNARIAKDLTESEVSTEQALELVDKVIGFFETTAQKGGDVISRLGIATVRKAVGA